MEEKEPATGAPRVVAYRLDLTNSAREPPMKIKRVEHIAIAVDSLNQSASILRDAFGINIEYEEQVGSTRLAMLPVGET